METGERRIGLACIFSDFRDGGIDLYYCLCHKYLLHETHERGMAFQNMSGINPFLVFV